MLQVFFKIKKLLFRTLFLLVFICINVICNSCTKPKYPVENYVSHIRANPDEADKFINLGYAYFTLKKYDSAAEAFSNAVKINPNDEEAMFRYGLSKEKLQSFQEAADAFKQVYPFTGLNITHTECGLALKCLDYQEEAIDEFMKAIDEDEPHPGYLYSKIGELYYKLQMYDMSIETYNKGIEIMQNQLDLYHFHYNIGVIYQKNSDFESAIQAYRSSTQFDPDKKHDAHFQLGNCYFQLGNYNEAFNYYHKTVSIDPTDSKAYYYLCLISFVHKKNFKEAEKYFQILSQLDSQLTLKLKQYLISLSQ